MKIKFLLLLMFMLGSSAVYLSVNKLRDIFNEREEVKETNLNVWMLKCTKQVAFTRTFSNRLVDNYESTEEEVYYLGLIEVDSEGYFDRYNAHDLKNGSCAFLIQTIEGDTLLHTTVGCYVEYKDDIDINYRAVATCKKE